MGMRPPTMNELEKGVVEIETGIAAGLGVGKTKGGSGDKEVAFVFSKDRFRRCWLFFLGLLVAFVLFALHSRYVITITTREAYDSERLRRVDSHSCNSQLIKVQNDLKARFERDHYRTMLAQGYYRRSKTSYAQFRSDVDQYLTTFKDEETQFSPPSAFVEGLQSIVQDHVDSGTSAGRKMFESIAADEKLASKQEKKLQASIGENLAREVKSAEDYKEFADNHDIEASDVEGSEVEDDDSETGTTPTHGELAKQVKTFFVNVRKFYATSKSSNLRITKGSAIYRRLKDGALQMLNGTFDESAMVTELDKSRVDFTQVGLEPYNKTTHGPAEDYIFEAIQSILLHTNMPVIEGIERNFTAGTVSGAEVMGLLQKLQEKGIIPAELFASDFDDYVPDGEDGDDNDDQEDPFDGLPDSQMGLEDDSENEGLDDDADADDDDTAADADDDTAADADDSIDADNDDADAGDNDDADAGDNDAGDNAGVNGVGAADDYPAPGENDNDLPDDNEDDDLAGLSKDDVFSERDDAAVDDAADDLDKEDIPTVQEDAADDNALDKDDDDNNSADEVPPPPGNADDEQQDVNMDQPTGDANYASAAAAPVIDQAAPLEVPPQ